MNYKCEACGKEILEEILKNSSVTSIIRDIDEDGYVEYGAITTEYGEIDRYQCAECGFVLKDEYDNNIDTVDGLIEFLKKFKND